MSTLSLEYCVADSANGTEASAKAQPAVKPVPTMPATTSAQEHAASPGFAD